MLKNNMGNSAIVMNIFTLLVHSYVCYFQFRRGLRKITGWSPTVYVWDRVEEYKDLWTRAAKTIEAEIVEVDQGIWVVSKNGKESRIVNNRVELDNPVALKIAGNKPLTCLFLRKSGIPIVEYSVFRLNELGLLKDFIDHNHGMFVVKPAIGSSAGIGVTTHLKNFGECLKAAALASLHGPYILVEKLVPGETYRLLVLDGEVISASRRDGKTLTGDGVSNIRALLASDYERGGLKVPSIASDRDLEAMISSQGLSLDSVLAAGQEILIRALVESADRTEEIRTVYTSDVTYVVCAEIQSAAAQACAAIGSQYAGVDVITMDPTRPLEETGGIVAEINTTPGLHHHYNLECGKHVSDPAARVLTKVLNTNDQRCCATEQTGIDASQRLSSLRDPCPE